MAEIRITNIDIVETTHGVRIKDDAVTPEGKTSHVKELPALHLKTPQLVRKIVVKKDPANGTLYLSLTKD